MRPGRWSVDVVTTKTMLPGDIFVAEMSTGAAVAYNHDSGAGPDGRSWTRVDGAKGLKVRSH